MVSDKDVTYSDFVSFRYDSPDATVIEHLSVSFYMGFINFDVSYRDFYEQRIQRAHWVCTHFYKRIPFRFWRRIIDADVNDGFLDTLLPSDYTSLGDLTISQLIAFLKRFTYWECGDVSDVDNYFQKIKKLQAHKR
jgi:hypothetical protein